MENEALIRMLEREEREYAVEEGKAFPLEGRNPFQLYESVHGWQMASAELVEAARGFYKALLQDKLGVTIL